MAPLSVGQTRKLWYNHEMPTHTPLLALLQKIVVLSPRQKRPIADRLQTLAPHAETAMRKTLEDVLREQDALLEKMVAADPEFVAKFNAYLEERMHELQPLVEEHDKETTEHLEEEFSRDSA